MPLILKQWVSVVDKRTTVVCLHAAGQTRQLEEPFETLAGNFDAPPAHVHCRAMVRPWMSGFVNMERVEANAELQRRPLPERRIGPGGVVGGRIPPPPADRGPLPAAVLPRRVPVTRFPDRAVDELIAVGGRRVAADVAADFRAGYTPDEEAAVSSWTLTGVAERINRVLRRGGTLRKADAALVAALDALLGRARLSEDAALYRGVSLSAEEYARLSRAGAQFIDYGYASASAERAVAVDGAAAGRGLVAAVLVVLAPAGTRAFLGAVRFGEVVLARGTRFEVVSASAEEIVVRVVG